MRRHAREILEKRLAPAVIANDGHQTPMRGYPVFKAQHATALCCRQCMQKWHGIAPGHRLTDKELDYAVALIMRWMKVAAKRPLTSAGSASKPKAKAHAGANKQKAEQEPSLF